MPDSKRGWLVLGVTVLFVLGWVASGALAVYLQWQVDQDTTANLDRAVQSSNATDMKHYIQDAQAGMDKWGYDEGHYALIFKTPQNNATLDYQASERMVDRLDRIEHKSSDSTEYQVAIDDIRGTIRDSEWQPYTNWTLNHTPFAVMYWYPQLGWLPAMVSWGLYKLVR